MKNFVSKLKQKCVKFKPQWQIGKTQFVTFPQIQKRITQINLIVHFFSVIPLPSGCSVLEINKPRVQNVIVN